jgi:ABC-type bacteriocin/lantibiotic exporter with double-glycine peptidase domain
VKLYKDLIFFFNKKINVDFNLICIFQLIIPILDFMGLALLVPIISFISNPNIFKNNYFFNDKFNYLRNIYDHNLIYILLFVLFIFFLFKNLFIFFFEYKKNLFFYNLEIYLSQKINNIYHQLPYDFFKKSNSSALVKNVISEPYFFYSIIRSFFSLISEILFLFLILIFLTIIQPLATILVLLIYSVIGFCFYEFNKKKIYKWGLNRQINEDLRYKHLYQSFQGIKEIKLYKLEKSFQDVFTKYHSIISSEKRKIDTIQQLPRLVVETFTILNIIILIFLSNLYFKNDINLLFPILVAFGLSAIRIIPSLGRILSALQNIKYSYASIEKLKFEFNRGEKRSEYFAFTKPLIFNNEIILNNISFKYSDSNFDILKKINFIIKKGSCVGIVGDSGAGKSTLIDLILGLSNPTVGSILVDNVDIYSNISGWQKNIGYVPQNIFLLDDTLKNNIIFGYDHQNFDRERFNAILEKSQINKFLPSISNGIETQIGERGVKLSGGQIQRIGIARALYRNPSLLILDESTNALDLKTEGEIVNLVNDLRPDLTIIIISHRKSTLNKCQKILQIDNNF